MLSPFLTPEQRKVLEDLVDQTQATLGQAAQLATSMYMMGEAATALAAVLGVAPWVAAAVLLIMFLIALFKGGGGGGGDGDGDESQEKERARHPHHGSAPNGQAGEGKPGHPGSGLPGRGDEEVVATKQPEAPVAKEMGRLQQGRDQERLGSPAPPDRGRLPRRQLARCAEDDAVRDRPRLEGRWPGTARAERLFLEASGNRDIILALRDLEGASSKANLKGVSDRLPRQGPTRSRSRSADWPTSRRTRTSR